MDPSRRSALTVLGVAAVSFVLAAVGTAADGWPLPRAFDEFSYVLAGETFATGRLANPAYVVPEAVKTIHVLQQPTYGSKYLPGHGLFLALGITLGGGPRLGQWMAFAVMGAAIYWMLTAWLSPRASLITAGLLILGLADTDWASGFWGSSLAVAGSALVFGSVRRLTKGPSLSLGILTGVGVVLLALTRPLEGLAVCVVPAAYLAWWVFASNEWRRRLTLFALPCALILALGAVMLVAHNKSVTGSARQLAYSLYEKSAPGAPPFIWQPVNAANTQLRANERARLNIDLGSYRGMRRDWSGAMMSRAKDVSLAFYLPHLVFGLVFFLVPVALRERKELWLLIASAAAVGLAISVSSFYLPHYLGPAVPPLLVLYAVGCGVIARLSLASRRVGRLATTSLTIALAAFGVWRLFAHTPLENAMTQRTYWTRQRDAIAQKLSAIPGKHVVFVRYAPSYKSQNEWVQNSADLRSTPLLWLHDLGEPTNAALGGLEADRLPWLVTVYGGSRVAELTRYETPSITVGGNAR